MTSATYFLTQGEVELLCHWLMERQYPTLLEAVTARRILLEVRRPTLVFGGESCPYFLVAEASIPD